MKNNSLKSWAVGALMLLVSSSALWAHCQIPCGIYNDQMRIQMLREHVTTIEKSMSQIVELSNAGDKNYNQLVRWVTNKEDHASKIQEIITDYFLTQRIKPAEVSDTKVYADYTRKTLTLHQILVFAMKSKQTTDLENCTKLRSLIDQFVDMYFDAEELEHLKEHQAR